MNLRTLSSSELPKVQPSKPQANAQSWKTIQHMNQLHPRGADQGYVNGAYNCAPTVVAMLARSAGVLKGSTDAQLITTLGRGLVSSTGTDAEGVAKMLGRAGLTLGGSVIAGKYSDATLKAHLEKGNKLIAQVSLTGKDSKEASAHYVLVRGINSKGNYIVEDPMAPKGYVVTPEQLREAINNAPPDGGLLIPVAPPGTPAAPSPSTARTSTPTATKVASDVFARMTASKRTESTPAMPAAPAPQAPQTAAPAPLNAATLNTINTARVLSSMFAGMAAPDPTAFSVEDTALDGVDTRFHEEAPRYTSVQEQQNVTNLNIDYGKKGAKRSLFTGLIQVSPKDQSVEQFVQDLRQRKQSKDPSVGRLLERLESSRNPTDKQVIKLFKQQELRDPGIGKKTSIDSF